MKIELVDRKTAKITLTEKDLDAMSISYEDMDYKNPETKRAILELIERVKEETGLDCSCSKLFIEAYPAIYGGCVLYINLLEKGKNAVVSKKAIPDFHSPIIFCFDDVNALLHASENLFRQYNHLVHKSSLYLMAERYYLIISSYLKLDDKLMKFLGEYGSFFGRGDLKISILKEHGKLLIDETAVETLVDLVC